MAISQSYIDGLTRQVFIRDYILNGLFPCQSDIVRTFRSSKRNWEYNDRFEYRMFLASSNTGGTLNSQIFNPDVSLRKGNDLTYGIFKATYGTVSDGFDVDMTINLETKESRGSFINEYSMRVHSMRINVASLFKNYAIHGRFGPVYRITPQVAATLVGSNIPTEGRPFTIEVPIDAYASGFKCGRYLIKTHGNGPTRGDVPWGDSLVSELYMILDNQPRKLTLVPVGTQITPWLQGQFLELFGNRKIVGDPDLTGMWKPAPANWPIFSDPMWNLVAQSVTVAQWTATGTYDSSIDPGVGAMEGLADLFPWHLDNDGVRAGLDRPFRNQQNRIAFATEQAGGFIVRQPNQSIIDCIMDGVALAMATVSHENLGVWMNPDTMLALGTQETEDVRWVKQIVSSSPVIFQRGVTSHDYRVGSKTIPATIQDYNLPTNIIIIGPRDNIQYNCWAQDMYKIDEYVQETFSSKAPPRAEEVSIPADFVTKLDFSRRITYGSPILGDHMRTTEFSGGHFIHPSNKLPVAFHEMGALFVEAPYAYVIINLRNQLVKPSDVLTWTD